MNELGETQKVSQWLGTFERALAKGDVAAALDLFADDCYWRDLVAFTWNIKTAEGKDAVGQMLQATLAATRPESWRMDGDGTEANGIVEAWFRFDTAVARCQGHVRLRGGKCWTLLTSMTELKGYEEHKGERRDNGVEHGAITGRRTWAERKARDEAQLGHAEQPYCVIVGGGQGGIALATRLKRLDVPTIVLERNSRPGDSWRNRYKSLCLHDPVWYDHLPYLPFPDHWPVFSPKDKLADWLEMYTKVMELNYWTSSACKSARYDEDKQEWTIVVDRDGDEVLLHPKELVLATGMSGVPHLPKIPGAESFIGVQHHSSEHRSHEGWAGKDCIVIGSNNSAHDICGDLWEHGADVTMIQRSSTHVSRSATLMELVLGGLYSESAVRAGITTEKADMIFASIPYRILPDIHTPIFAEMARRDAEFYERLNKVGFLHDFGEDGSGLFLKYLRRGSGYYIDVGASDLVADGKVKLRSGVEVGRIKEHSVVLTDGSELTADLIVYATGYGSMNGWAATLISQEVADRVGKCWGLGSGTRKDPGPWEGELRNMWKPTHQPGLWFHGGNLHQSRHYSQYLALQIKARKEGIPTKVFGLGPVHHLS